MFVVDNGLMTNDNSETLRFIKEVEAAGVDYITIHGRLRSQRSSTPPNFSAIKLLKSHATVPILANGDVYSLRDAHNIAAETGVDGVMSARGLLENPALFAGHETTPLEAVARFMHYCTLGGMRHELVVHHIAEMCGKMTSRKQRVGLMNCADMVDVIDWLDERWELQRMEV